MAKTIYNCDALIGGGTRALDVLSVASLVDKDRAICLVSGVLSVYEYNIAGTAAENVATHPYVVRPDDYATAGNWEECLIADTSLSSPLSLKQVGEISATPLETPLPGTLACDGAAVSRTTYAELFAVIADKYGAGDGVNTFNLPDYRGYFLRGWAHGQATDPDRASRTIPSAAGATILAGDHVGTVQEDATEEHTHALVLVGEAGSGGGTGIQVTGIGSPQGTASIYTRSTVGNETRPINVNVLFCIKY